MKEKAYFRLSLIIVLLFILAFWAFAFFLTENKPIHVPLYVKVDFNNYWLLLPLILFFYYFIFKAFDRKQINLKKNYLLSLLLIISFNLLKISLPLHQPLTNSNDYYQDALKITDLSRWLASFHRRTYAFRLHTKTHPPGPVLFHFFVNQLFPNQIIFNALLMILISNLSLLVVYKISNFFQNQNKNLNVILFISSPGFLIFSATCPDAIYAFLISASIYSLLLLSKSFSLKNIIIGSLWIFLATFFTYASVIIPLFSFFYILSDKFKNKKYILSQILILVIISFLYLILNLATGFEPIKTFISARNFNTMLMPDIFMTFKRYLFSVSANFIEYFIYLGLPITSLLLLTIVSSFKKAKKTNNFRYYLSFLLPIILLNVLGIYKTGQFSGETGRIWLFLTPLVIGGLKIKDKKLLKLNALLSFSQALIMQISFNTFW